MGYKLSDFYVGVVDFFSVLLPGALLAFLFRDSYVWREIIGPTLPSIQEGLQEWAVFIVASYLLGHFVNLVASYLDHSYDFLMGRQGKGGRIQAFLVRRSLIRGIHGPALRARDAMRKTFVTGRDLEALPRRVMAIRNERLNDAADNDLINAFQWAKINLLLQHPAAAVEVQRLEADSKFFRSLVIVLSLTCITLVIKTAWLALVACIILTILSFWGYVKRRWKGVTLAYMYYIASEHLPNSEVASEPSQ